MFNSAVDELQGSFRYFSEQFFNRNVYFARRSFVQNKHWILSPLFVKSFDMSPAVIKNKFSTNVIELVVLRKSMPDQNI